MFCVEELLNYNTFIHKPQQTTHKSSKYIKKSRKIKDSWQNKRRYWIPDENYELIREGTVLSEKFGISLKKHMYELKESDLYYFKHKAGTFDTRLTQDMYVARLKFVQLPSNTWYIPLHCCLHIIYKDRPKVNSLIYGLYNNSCVPYWCDAWLRKKVLSSKTKKRYVQKLKFQNKKPMTRVLNQIPEDLRKKLQKANFLIDGSNNFNMNLKVIPTSKVLSKNLKELEQFFETLTTPMVVEEEEEKQKKYEEEKYKKYEEEQEQEEEEEQMEYSEATSEEKDPVFSSEEKVIEREVLEINFSKPHRKLKENLKKIKVDGNATPKHITDLKKSKNIKKKKRKRVDEYVKKFKILKGNDPKKDKKLTKLLNHFENWLQNQ